MKSAAAAPDFAPFLQKIKDGKPDAYQFFAMVNGESRVVRKEIDVNFDGKIDYIRKFDDKGELAAPETRDFFGKVMAAFGAWIERISSVFARSMRGPLRCWPSRPV